MRTAYATATVVGRTAPVSAHLGDRAIVYEDGRMEGFVGGACSCEIVRAQALRAIGSGEPRLVRIRPDATELDEQREVVTVPMSCTSEGAVDVYIEPWLARRQFIIAGNTPVTEALRTLTEPLCYDVVCFKDEAAFDDFFTYADGLETRNRARSVAIAASQGHFDERALSEFLQYDFGFVGLLASRKRGAAVLDALAGRGVPSNRLATVRSPVGLPIGARSAAEVAVSILAEVIATFSEQSESDRHRVHANGALAVDPVCGMEIAVATAEYYSNTNGDVRYFCSAHCLAAFAAS